MSDIKIVVGADVAQAASGLRVIQGELGKTASIAKTATASFSGVGTAARSLGSALLSGGVLTGVVLVGAALLDLAKSAFEMSKEQQRLNDVLSEAKGAYVKATIEVNNMQVAFDQARSGVISKGEALKLFNTTIGKTIGQTQDLEEAEKMFIANADNYIKFTLLKAAANIALGKAAEAAFKAELERERGPKPLTLLESMRNIGSRFGATVSPEIIQQEKINAAIKQENEFKAIANTLQNKAIELGLDFNAVTEKEIKVRKERIKVAKKEKEESMKFLPRVSNERGLQDLISNITAKGPLTSVEAKIVIKPTPILESANFPKELTELAKELTSIIQSTFTDAFVGIGDAIGEAISGRGNLFGGIFSAIFKALGAGLRQLGVYAVATSKLILALKATLGTTLGIAGGIALIALGTIISAAASKITAPKFASGVRGFSGGFATVGERGAERVFLPSGSSVQPNNEMNAFSSGSSGYIAETRISGTDLVVLLRRGEQQMGRNN